MLQRDVVQELRDEAAGAERASVALPLAAIALLAPLSMHLALAGFFDLMSLGAGASMHAEQFGLWIGASVLLAGLAHLTLVLRCVLWAASLRAAEPAKLRDEAPQVALRTLAMTVAAGLIPAVFWVVEGQAVVLLPAAIIFITGLPLIPWMFMRSASRIVEERALLAPA
jgi:hypothetical protein